MAFIFNFSIILRIKKKKAKQTSWSMVTISLYVVNFLFLFFNLTQARVIWEEGPLIGKMPPLDWPVGLGYSLD